MIADIITRLRAEAMPPLRLVAGAAEYARLQAPPPQAKQPAAYVLPIADVAEPNALLNGLRQRVTRTIGVVLLVTDLRDPRGEAAADALAAPVAAVRAALAGWRSAPDADPMEFAGGRLIDITEGALAWQEEFSVAGHLRAL